MTRNIDYNFSAISPFAYLGHAHLVDIANRNNASISFKPIDLVQLFPQSGGLPFHKRHPARQKYTMYEMKRWRDIRNIRMTLGPRPWPFNYPLIDKMIIAAGLLGHDPAEYTFNILKAGWTDKRDLTDTKTILEVATECNLPATECHEKAESVEAQEAYDNNTTEAIQSGCFGSPTYFLNGEIFFGQDTLDQLDDALKSGREPYNL